MYFINLENWNYFGNLIESFKWNCRGLSCNTHMCFVWIEVKMNVDRCWLFKHRTIIPLYAQFDYGSWLLWWLLCEYCDSFFLTTMHNIVGRLWLKVEYKIKQDQLYMGNYHQVSFGFTINYHAANMRPTCCQHVTMHCLFAFCPTNISKILAFDVDTFRCGKANLIKSKK